MSTTADNQTAIVWGLGAEKSGQLIAFDGDTGKQLFASDSVTGVRNPSHQHVMCLHLRGLAGQC